MEQNEGSTGVRHINNLLRGTAAVLPFARRIAFTVVTLLAISFVSYMILQLVSGDLARQALGREATENQLEAFRQQNGLNDPVLLQYWHWLSAFVQGDWGTDPVSQRPISEAVLEPLKYTGILAAVVVVVSVPLSLGFGLIAALWQGRALDRTLLITSVVLVAIPEFVMGTVLIFFLAVKFPIFPVDSTAVTYAPTLIEMLYAIALPSIILIVAMCSYLFRVARAACSEVRLLRYVEAAMLRGVGTWRLATRYILRNSLAPLVNTIGVSIVYLIGGVIVVEQIFGYPGIGRALVAAVAGGGFNTVQMMVVLLAGLFLVLGALADMFTSLLTRHDR